MPGNVFLPNRSASFFANVMNGFKIFSTPVAVAPAVPSGPSEKLASSSLHSSVSAPPSPFHSDAASPHTPSREKTWVTG